MRMQMCQESRAGNSRISQNFRQKQRSVDVVELWLKMFNAAKLLNWLIIILYKVLIPPILSTRSATTCHLTNVWRSRLELRSYSARLLPDA